MTSVRFRDATGGASVGVKRDCSLRPLSRRPSITVDATSPPTITREYVRRCPAQPTPVSN